MLVFFNVPPTTEIYTLSLHDALPISQQSRIGEDLGLKNGAGWRHFGVLTLHRPSNVDSTEKLIQLLGAIDADRKSTRLNSSHRCISYAVFCLKKKKDKKYTIVISAHR